MPSSSRERTVGKKVRGAIAPRKPVKRIEMYALCRNGKKGGYAEFRNFYLERREGRVFPSIRLATVRDGVQDFEWLQIAERKFGRAKVDAVSRTIIRSLTDFERTPEAIEKARATIGDMIESAD